jgi:autotransporter-associated beta strand protein
LFELFAGSVDWFQKQTSSFSRFCSFTHRSDDAPDPLLTMKSFPLRRLLPVAALLGSATFAHAANGTWTSTTGGLWSDTTRWAGGAVVVDGDGANLSTIDITADMKVSLDGPRALTGMAFGDNDPATAAGWVLDNNGNPANILTLVGTHTITVNALGTGKTATISAEIAGAAGLLKTGTGTLVLTRTNTYTGATNVRGGTVVVGANNALGAGGLGMENGTTLAAPTGSEITLTNPVVNFGAGATQITFGDTAHAGGLIFSAGASFGGYPKTFAVAPGAVVTFPGVVSGNWNARLTKTGEGTLVLAGGCTIPAATTVSAGTLVIAGASASPVTVDAAGTLQIGTGAENVVTFGGPAGIRITDGGVLKLGGLVAGALDGTDSVVNFSGSAYDFKPAGKLDLGGVLNNLPAGDHTYKIFSKGGAGAEPLLANISGFDATVAVSAFDKGVLTFKSIPKATELLTYLLIGAGVLATIGALAGSAVWFIRRRRRPVVVVPPSPPAKPNYLPPPPGAE